MSVKASSNPSAASVASILAGTAKVPSAPASPGASVVASSVSVETVGQHYDAQVDSAINTGLSAIGTGVHFTAEAVPGVLLAEVASIKASHQYQAYQQIYSLPWDPQGKWKAKADQIMADQSAQADAEIRKLPMVSAAIATGNAVVSGASAVGHAVVNGATYVGTAVEDGATAVANGVSAAGSAVVNGTVSAYNATVNGISEAGNYVATTATHTYKAAGRGFLGWLADLGQSLVNWATGHKAAFSN